jgi:lipoprotein-anchoring transpeptidase ErfK/SrfK
MAFETKGRPGPETAMGLRLLGFLALAGALLVADARVAAAQSFELDEKREMLNAGAPRSRGYSFFSGWNDAVPKTTVSFQSSERPGTIIINTAERRLYYVLGDGRAIRYGIGVGRDGFTWKGVKTVTAKKEWPSWTPPPQMLRRRPDLPRHMVGGVDNPLGARAMYLGSSLYRIHGSNEPETIGQAVSSGCFRMTNDDVVDLYDRVKVGTKVIVN